jgi:hypothetical protein
MTDETSKQTESSTGQELSLSPPVPQIGSAESQQGADSSPVGDRAVKREEVAISGSPNSTTSISFDVRKLFLATPLLGSLLGLDVVTRDNDTEECLRVLGQVASVTTRNRWHEEPSLKNFIKLKGALPHLSTVGDFTSGELEVVGAYVVDPASKRLKGSLKRPLPIPPSSGLQMFRVDRETIKEIMAEDFGYGYLGNFYGSPGVPAPVYVRHFGNFKEKGSGESYMGGVFGPSGCGKTVIAASLIALWAQSRSLGILILDPQSEFSNNRIASGTGFDFDFFEILSQTSTGRFDPKHDVLNLDSIRLEGATMFVEILREKDFFEHLGVGISKIQDSAEAVANWLDELPEERWQCSMGWDDVNALSFSARKKSANARKKPKTPVEEEGDDSPQEETFAHCFCMEAAVAYAASGREQYEGNFETMWDTDTGHHLQKAWDETVAYFATQSETGTRRTPLKELLTECVTTGKIRILDLNPSKVNMGAQLKIYLMDFVFRKLRQISHEYYKSDKTGNCLIVLDEAGRFIPQDAGENEKLRSLSRELTESVKEMRKMRCGFMFITQTVTEIQKDVFRNLHYRIYGVGLGVGADADHIKAREGDRAFELYRTLPDPRLSKIFSYMVCGTLVAIGSSGLPMFIQGFDGGPTLLENNMHLKPIPPNPGVAGIPVSE